MASHQLFYGFLLILITNCGSVQFFGEQFDPPDREIETEEQAVVLSRDVATEDQIGQGDDVADEDVTNESIGSSNEDEVGDEPVAEEALATGAWTLFSREAKSGKHHIVGCLGSSVHRYEAPTIERVKEFRVKLLEAFEANNIEHSQVWTSTSPGGIDYQVIDLKNAEETVDRSVFGGSHMILCYCPDPSLGAECGGAEARGFPIVDGSGNSILIDDEA